MSMNKELSKPDIQTIKSQLKKYTSSIRRYSLIIFLVVITGLYGYIILGINQAYQTQPNAANTAEEIGTIKRLKIDQDSINKIKQLQDQNISVQSLFEEARQNPFAEE